MLKDTNSFKTGNTLLRLEYASYPIMYIEYQGSIYYKEGAIFLPEIAPRCLKIKISTFRLFYMDVSF